MAKNETDDTIERVDVTIPRARAGEDPNLFVGINGVNYILPKGKTSTVPVFVAEEIKRSEGAKDYQDEYSDAKRAKNPG